MRSMWAIPDARKLALCLYLGLSTFIAAHIVNAFVADALQYAVLCQLVLDEEGHVPDRGGEVLSSLMWGGDVPDSEP